MDHAAESTSRKTSLGFEGVLLSLLALAGAYGVGQFLGLHSRATPAPSEQLSDGGRYRVPASSPERSGPDTALVTVVEWCADAAACDAAAGRMASLRAQYGERMRHVVDREGAASSALFVNGRRMVGTRTDVRLARLIDQELAHAEAELIRGVPASRLYDAITSEGTWLESTRRLASNR